MSLLRTKLEKNLQCFVIDTLHLHPKAAICETIQMTNRRKFYNQVNRCECIPPQAKVCVGRLPETTHSDIRIVFRNKTVPHAADKASASRQRIDVERFSISVADTKTLLKLSLSFAVGTNYQISNDMRLSSAALRQKSRVRETATAGIMTALAVFDLPQSCDVTYNLVSSRQSSGNHSAR